MTVTKGPLGSPLPLGKTFPVLTNQPVAAGTDVHKFGVDSDGILISVDVFAVTGTVTVSVDTIGNDDSVRNVISFPGINSPTAEPEIRTAVNILSTIRVTVTYTGACNYQVRARGISRGAAGADDAPLNVTVDVDPLLVTNPQTINDILTTAGAEQPVVLPLGVKRFKLQAVNTAILDYAYSALNPDRFTVFAGNTEEENYIDEDAPQLTLYIKSNKNNTPIQLLCWT